MAVEDGEAGDHDHRDGQVQPYPPEHQGAEHHGRQGDADLHARQSYGVEVPPPAPVRLLDHWGLTPRGYDLVVCRLEPENHVLEIIRGWRAAQRAGPLVIVGDHRGESRHVRTLLREADEAVRFIGGVYEPESLIALRQGCRVYLHGHSVGGTNPSLLEAMACGNRVIAHDNPFNREVLGDLGRYFADADDVATRLRALAQDAADDLVATAMIARVRERFDWDDITERYVAAFSLAQADADACAHGRADRH